MKSKNAALAATQPQRLAERAWHVHTCGCAGPPERWFDLAEQFVAVARPKNPERTCAALLLALDNAGGWEDFLRGGWTGLIQPHVYVYSMSRGLAPLMAVGVAERFVKWLGKERFLHEWDARRLLSALDRERLAAGATPKGAAPAHDTCVPLSEIGEVVAAFCDDLVADAPPRDLIAAAVRLGAIASVAPETELVRFGALDPYELSLMMADAARNEGDDPAAVQSFDQMIYSILIDFYGWLGRTARLTPSRAAEIVEGLRQIIVMPLASMSDQPS